MCAYCLHVCYVYLLNKIERCSILMLPAHISSPYHEQVKMFIYILAQLPWPEPIFTCWFYPILQLATVSMVTSASSLLPPFTSPLLLYFSVGLKPFSRTKTPTQHLSSAKRILTKNSEENKISCIIYSLTNVFFLCLLSPLLSGENHVFQFKVSESRIIDYCWTDLEIPTRFPA